MCLLPQNWPSSRLPGSAGAEGLLGVCRGSVPSVGAGHGPITAQHRGGGWLRVRTGHRTPEPSAPGAARPRSLRACSSFLVQRLLGLPGSADNPLRPHSASPRPVQGTSQGTASSSQRPPARGPFSGHAEQPLTHGLGGEGPAAAGLAGLLWGCPAGWTLPPPPNGLKLGSSSLSQSRS